MRGIKEIEKEGALEQDESKTMGVVL